MTLFELKSFLSRVGWRSRPSRAAKAAIPPGANSKPTGDLPEWRTDHVATLAFDDFRIGFGSEPMDGRQHAGASGRRIPRPLLLLSLLLLSAQLLAEPGPSVAGKAGQSLHATTGLHGLP